MKTKNSHMIKTSPYNPKLFDLSLMLDWSIGKKSVLMMPSFSSPIMTNVIIAHSNPFPIQAVRVNECVPFTATYNSASNKQPPTFTHWEFFSRADTKIFVIYLGI